MSRTAKRAVFTAVAAGAVGIGTAFIYVIPYAIAELYLTGHSMKPAWFDTAAEVLLFIVAGGSALLAGTAAWRANPPQQ